MTVACAEVTLLIPFAHSLKEKRMVARSVMDSVRSRFHASVAEVDAQELHQRLVIGFAVVSGEAGQAARMRETILGFVDNQADAAGAQVIDARLWEA